MAKKEFRRPDEEAMRRVLKRYEGTVEEIILRLAWTMGLSVTEMVDLTWNAVSFETGEVLVSGRTVPMNEEMQRCLQSRFENPAFQKCEFIVTSDLRKKHLHRVNVSNYASAALDLEESLRAITLTDLREDFVIRQLEQHDRFYALRITGLSLMSLQVNYSQFIQKETHIRRGATAKSTEFTQEDEFRFWKLIQEEGASDVGIALWMVWQLGLTLKEIVSLTWEDVDLDAAMINLEDRQIPMGVTLQRRLREVFAGRSPDDDPHILLTPNARTPYRKDRLSAVIGDVLARNDMTKFGLANLGRVKGKQKALEVIRRYLKENGAFKKEEIEAILPDSDFMIRQQLNFLVRTGEITRVGTTYYPADEVVPLEMHETVILEYVRDHTGVRLAELTELLGIGSRQSFWIVDQLTKEGKLLRLRRKYYIPGSVKPEEECSEEFFETAYEKIVQMLKERGSVQRFEIIETLEIPENSCAMFLKRLVEESKLVRLGNGFYLPGTIVPPEQHSELVQAYLKEHGTAKKSNLAELLKLEENACANVLRKLVKEGKIVKERRRYFLPEDMDSL